MTTTGGCCSTPLAWARPRASAALRVRRCRAYAPAVAAGASDVAFHPDVSRAAESLQAEFRAVDRALALNSSRVAAAFRRARVAPHHFGGSTGYGHDDGGGREALDAVFAEIVGAETAIVRPQFFSGTHAIACALFALLRPGHELLAVSGPPYDTLEEVIGIRGSANVGSLKDFGVAYREVLLAADGGLDWEALACAIRPETGCAFIQRSCGYSWRKSLSVADIHRAISLIKLQNPNCMVMVDNCYGEFVETSEPAMVGADLIAGSLIKNPGGTIAPCGGYVAGKRNLVEAAAARLSAPGLGVEFGSIPGHVMRSLFQGLFLAPQMVGEAIKGGLLIAEVMSAKGYRVQPLPRVPRHDIVQAVELGNRERLIAFCEVVQQTCPVGSFVKPTAGETPGYASEVIFADGTFIDGSTSELSCDGPLRDPYAVFCQRLDLKSARQLPSSVAQSGSSSNATQSSSARSNATRAPTFDHVKAKFAAFFTQQRDEELEPEFLKFLREYTVNGKQFYKTAVMAMKELDSQQMIVRFAHVLSSNGPLATLLCNCFDRIQSNLNNAARIFIEDLKADLNCSCENPVVIIYDLLEPNSWMALESFFALEGNHPYDPIDIFCGGIHLMIPESTLIGRIVLANLFSTMSDAFCDGRSWNGEWGLPDVLVNRKLEVEIARPYCERTTINTIQNDLTRGATNVISKYVFDGKLPVFFMHLDSSLRVFSSKYSMTKLREFCNFIASHPALKSALANLALIDGIYSVNQSVSWRAKKLLESVINVPNPFSDWRKIFMDERYLVDNSVVPPVLTSVWEHAKKKMQDISENNPSEVAAGIHKDNEPCFGENIAGEGNPEDKSMLPFDGTAGDGLKIQRHSRYHGTKASMDEWGNQQLGSLSELLLINSHFLGDVLPVIMERISLSLDDFHEEYDDETYDELLRWLNEQLEFYNRQS